MIHLNLSTKIFNGNRRRNEWHRFVFDELIILPVPPAIGRPLQKEIKALQMEIANQNLLSFRKDRFIDLGNHLFNAREYLVQFYFIRDATQVLLRVDDLVSMEMREPARTNGWLGAVPGLVRPRLAWSLDALPPGPETA